MNNDSQLTYREVPNLVAGISGIVCAPIVFILLAVVVCGFRAYKTTFQRLILYHVIIALFCECSFALRIIQIDFSHPKWLCVITVYFYSYCNLFWYVYTTAVTNYLLLLTLRLLRGNSKLWWYGKLAECFCVCLSLALPAAYVWMAIRDAYEAQYCESDEVYSATWDKDAIILNIVILVLCLEVLVVSLTLCRLFCYLRRVYKAQRQLTTFLKHFIYYTGMSVVFIFVVVLETSYYKHTSDFFIINIIGGAIVPPALLISAVLQTLLSVRHQNSHYCQKICKICYKSRRQVTQEQPYYMDTEGNENQTNPPSNPLNQPSHTYFSVPYTGAFTQVVSDEHYPGIGEHTPLIYSQ